MQISHKYNLKKQLKFVGEFRLTLLLKNQHSPKITNVPQRVRELFPSAALKDKTKQWRVFKLICLICRQEVHYSLVRHFSRRATASTEVPNTGPRDTVHKTDLTHLYQILHWIRLCPEYLHVCLFKYDSVWPGLIVTLISVVVFANSVTVQLLICHLGPKSILGIYAEYSYILSQWVINWI